MSAVVTLAVWISLAGLASAQEATSAAAARALFDEGVALADAQDWSAAAERFDRALHLRDSTVIAFNLGLAIGHTGRVVEAAELFRRCVRDREADAALRARARTELDAITSRIAWVTVLVSGDSAGAALVIDGATHPAELVGAPIPLDPGEHQVSFARGDIAVAAVTFSLAPGERAEQRVEIRSDAAPEMASARGIDLDLDPAAVAGASSSPPPRDDTGVWVGVGIGIGVVVATAIIVAVALSAPGETPYSGTLGARQIGP